MNFKLQILISLLLVSGVVYLMNITIFEEESIFAYAPTFVCVRGRTQAEKISHGIKTNSISRWDSLRLINIFPSCNEVCLDYDIGIKEYPNNELKQACETKNPLDKQLPGSNKYIDTPSVARVQ